MNLWNLPRTEEEAIFMLQQYKILPEKRECPNLHSMKIYFGARPFWKCNVAKCSQQIGIRIGNWFEKSRLPFTTAIRFIYCWSKELATVKFCLEELEMADKTVTDWNNFLCEVCVLVLQDNGHKRIGGKNLIVEIYESMPLKRRNKTSGLPPSQWIIGGMCKDTNEVFLVIVPDKSAMALMNKIKENVKEGCIIYSDCWAKFKTKELKMAGFTHNSVGHHIYSFRNWDKGVETQHIERMWGPVMWRNKMFGRTERHHLETNLVEFIWRKTQETRGSNCFESILHSIASKCPPLIIGKKDAGRNSTMTTV